jgi:hypothetical protein
VSFFTYSIDGYEVVTRAYLLVYFLARKSLDEFAARLVCDVVVLAIELLDFG